MRYADRFTLTDQLALKLYVSSSYFPCSVNSEEKMDFGTPELGTSYYIAPELRNNEKLAKYNEVLHLHYALQKYRSKYVYIPFTYTL